MCGIVGFSARRDVGGLRESLSEATSRMIHRGPDDGGIFFDAKAGVGLGHRRLSVIDLSAAGHQPMGTHDGRVQIVYNGEIYNFKEIRKTLKGVGHSFRTETDTEVILEAYLEWGMECLTHFVGMFAFALWDTKIGTLFLARDRIGIKPLYYYFIDGKLLFASELKALMALEGFPKDIDPEAVPLFLHYQYVPAPRTIFKDTWKLLPGHYLAYDGENLDTRAYWNLPGPADEEDFEGNESDAVDALDRVLSEAVSCRLISDVPLGALLSGGIDSSLVAALMQKVSHAPVRTFSIGFNEAGYNEAPWAARVAAHLGTDHTEFYVTPQDAIDVIPRLPEIYDEPFADASAVPTCLVSRLARTRVTVALSGDGGDEQFAGYVRYWSARAMATGFQRLPERVRKSLGRVLERIPVSWIEKCYMPWRDILPQRFCVTNFPDKWEKLVSLMGRVRLDELYRMTICLWSEHDLRALCGSGPAPTRFEETFMETKEWPVLSRLMRVDQKTYLPDAMLTKVDRASMAFSLEVRVPLLDHRVLEFTSRIPDSLKYREGKGKYLLRRLLARYVPEALFERPKMGFGVPIDTWFRGGLKELLLDYLSTERLRGEGLFHCAEVEKKIQEHLSFKANHQYRLWALLMWEMWREQWLG
ncbi:MAG: asparagine synthase (glutamine-hydrolyzing) [Deltaproteobacteria bacterium]|nr:asparagine synthase (glutamine-hydrolyzing) [Deltaproteobacteria bacterium]